MGTDQVATPSSTASASGDLQKVILCTNQGGLGDWESYVGTELGYFKDEGIDLQINSFKNGPDINSATIAGKCDVATANALGVIAAVLNGAPVAVISATQSAVPGGKFNNWWASLPNSGITKPADLRGKNVNVGNIGSIGEAVTRTVLSNAGLTKDDWKVVAAPFPQAWTTLETGQADATIFIEPFFTTANKASVEKYGKPLNVIYTMLDAFPNGINLALVFANTDFTTAHPEVTRAYLRGNLRAAKWGNAHPVELEQILAKYAGVSYDDIKGMIPSEMSEDGQFVPGYFDRLQEIMVAQKMLPNLTAPISTDRFVDLSYLP